jgi:glycerol-3-phosphate cytidylyltransferase-like family protein
MVSGLKPVSLAVGGTDMMETFYRVRPDIVVFGYDQMPMALPAPCNRVHLETVKADPSMAKTSRIIRDLGL